VLTAVESKFLIFAENVKRRLGGGHEDYASSRNAFCSARRSKGI
jgi:hypothetical protein